LLQLPEALLISQTNTMKILNLTIDKKHICYTYLINDGKDSETEKSEKCPEAPLAELGTSFANLNPVVCAIMGFPPSYGDGLSVYKISLCHTKAGMRSVKMKFTKVIDMTGGELHKIDTPFVRIDMPSDGESGSREMKDAHVRLVELALIEISRYIGGERSQQLLNFDETKKGLNALAQKGAADLLDFPVQEKKGKKA